MDTDQVFHEYMRNHQNTAMSIFMFQIASS